MNIRQKLENLARELGCFDDPENHTDQELLDAIKCEQACMDWMARWETLPTEGAQREAVHRLRLSLEGNQS